MKKVTSVNELAALLEHNGCVMKQSHIMGEYYHVCRHTLRLESFGDVMKEVKDGRYYYKE